MGNKFGQHQGEIDFIEVFMAHWHPVAVFMTHCARHTTKQPDSLKGIRTNQYRQNQTLIIQQDIFSVVYCWIATHANAQETSAQFYFHNSDNTWVELNLHVADCLLCDITNNYWSTGYNSNILSERLYSKQYDSPLSITADIGHIRNDWILCTVIMATTIRCAQLACNNINSYPWWIFRDNEMYYGKNRRS